MVYTFNVELELVCHFLFIHLDLHTSLKMKSVGAKINPIKLSFFKSKLSTQTIIKRNGPLVIKKMMLDLNNY